MEKGNSPRRSLSAVIKMNSCQLSIQVAFDILSLTRNKYTSGESEGIRKRQSLLQVGAVAFQMLFLLKSSKYKVIKNLSGLFPSSWYRVLKTSWGWDDMPQPAVLRGFSQFYIQESFLKVLSRPRSARDQAFLEFVRSVLFVF